MSLSVESLHATLAGNEVLRNVNLRVGAGELVCLVGRNGAGKTSAFRSQSSHRWWPDGRDC